VKIKRSIYYGLSQKSHKKREQTALRMKVKTGFTDSIVGYSISLTVSRESEGGYEVEGSVRVGKSISTLKYTRIISVSETRKEDRKAVDSTK